MAAFERYVEYDGNEVALRDIFDNVIKNVDTDYIYWSVLIKDYFGKNIEIKIENIKDDAERDIYVVKKADSIRNTACSEGSLKAFNNENGFAGYACLLDEKPSLFYWNVRCSNPDAVVVQDTDKSEPYCAVYRKDYLIPYAINEYCEGDGYELVIENKTCEKRNFLYKEFHYECQDDGRLEMEKCFVDVTKPALKK